MTPTLNDLAQLLQRAAHPEEVFGPLPTPTLAALKSRYRTLAAIAHPDHNPHAVAASHAAFKLLGQWYQAAQARVAQGVYGQTPVIAAHTPLHNYRGWQAPLPGDLCDLYPVEADGAAFLLKVVRSAANHDLLRAEAQALRRLEQALAGQPVRAHFPTWIEQFDLRDAQGTNTARRTHVLRHEREFVTLAAILKAFPQGIEAADAAWMFNRTLTALGIAHSLGIIHGCLTPAHILVRLADHGGMLVDWCYSVPAGQTVAAISPPYKQHAAPEITARQPASPATDIYMAARCMVLLLGGSGPVETLPKRVPSPIQHLLRACLLPSPSRRTNDAWQLLADFGDTLRHLYGPPTFRPFTLPHAN